LYGVFDRLYIADLLLVSAIVITNYILDIDIWPKTFLYLTAVIASINIYFIRLRRSSIIVPIWIIPLLGLTSLLATYLLENTYGLLLLYTLSILLVIIINVSIIRLLDKLWFPESLLFLILALIAITLLLHIDNINWILLGPISELLLVKTISPVSSTNNFSFTLIPFLILSSLLVSIISNVGLYLVVLALIMNSFKALAQKPRSITLSLLVDYLLRFTAMVLLTWSTGIY